MEREGKIRRLICVGSICLGMLLLGAGCGNQSGSAESAYQLYPTQNMWTFIKLDTCTGKMWQVQYAVNEGNRGEVILNDVELVGEAGKATGRFTLYPTQNMYNFLLLDQQDGRVWQVQWSMQEDNRGIIDQIE